MPRSGGEGACADRRRSTPSSTSRGRRTANASRASGPNRRPTRTRRRTRTKTTSASWTRWTATRVCGWPTRKAARCARSCRRPGVSRASPGCRPAIGWSPSPPIDRRSSGRRTHPAGDFRRMAQSRRCSRRAGLSRTCRSRRTASASRLSARASMVRSRTTSSSHPSTARSRGTSPRPASTGRLDDYAWRRRRPPHRARPKTGFRRLLEHRSRTAAPIAPLPEMSISDMARTLARRRARRVGETSDRLPELWIGETAMMCRTGDLVERIARRQSEAVSPRDLPLQELRRTRDRGRAAEAGRSVRSAADHRVDPRRPDQRLARRLRSRGDSCWRAPATPCSIRTSADRPATATTSWSATAPTGAAATSRTSWPASTISSRAASRIPQGSASAAGRTAATWRPGPSRRPPGSRRPSRAPA